MTKLLLMKTNLFILLVVVLTAFNTLNAQINCDVDSTGLVSLVDLKTGYYEGYQGGLYPGGSNNIPAFHYNEGIKMAKKVVPLDSLGNVDWMNGKVIWISLGASVAGGPFNNFKQLTKEYYDINPCLQIINATVGSAGLDDMVDPIENPLYWENDVFPQIEGKGATREMVQIIWMKHGYRYNEEVFFPEFPETIVDYYKQLMPILMDTFPNLKLLFLTGFAYGGYADSTTNLYPIIMEPSSYWSNFAVKWLVEEQINLNPALKYTGAGRKAPWMCWGPHVWADGLRPNQYDSLFWDCEADFRVDGGGYHLTNEGKQKEGNVMIEWARNHPIAKQLYLDGPRWNTCDAGGRLSSGETFSPEIEDKKEEWNLYPSPNNGVFNIQIGEVQGNTGIRIVNAQGSIVWNLTGQDLSNSGNLSVDLGDIAPGIYHVIINDGREMKTLRFVVNQ